MGFPKITIPEKKRALIKNIYYNHQLQINKATSHNNIKDYIELA